MNRGAPSNIWGYGESSALKEKTTEPEDPHLKRGKSVLPAVSKHAALHLRLEMGKLAERNRMLVSRS